MPNPTQMGIKWWKYCNVCEWRARTQGAVGDRECALTVCPNCNNPNLGVELDEEVFEERRYDVRVRNTKGQAIADGVRQNAGSPPAPPDTVDHSNRGHDYGSGPKPFPP